MDWMPQEQERGMRVLDGGIAIFSGVEGEFAGVVDLLDMQAPVDVHQKFGL
jgi:translation elongation factor EF-G